MHGRSHSFLRVLTAALVAAAVASIFSAPAVATNDAEWGRQWGPQRIGVEQAFAAGVTGSGVKIGIVDSGVDMGHPDLAGKVVANAACIKTGGNPGLCNPGGGGDVDGHGTHVAGIAAAYKDNGIGISGVAPAAELVVARVFDGDTARSADVNAGVKWVVDRGAKVVNLSVGELLPFGEVFGSDELRPGIDYAWSKGAVPVLAAGNNNLGGFGSANYGGLDAIVVGATGPDDRPAGYSSPTGDAKWAIMAPGGTGGSSGVFSTLPSARYGYLSGTSMAAPHVSGALALLMSQGKTNAQAVSTLLATVDRSVPCSENSRNCHGRLDVACAVGRCPTTTAATTTTTRAPADGGSGGGQTAGTPGSGSSQPQEPSGSGSAPPPTGSSGGGGGSAPPAPESDAGPGAVPGRGGTAAAAGPAPTGSSGAGARSGSNRPSGLAALLRRGSPAPSLSPAVPTPPTAPGAPTDVATGGTVTSDRTDGGVALDAPRAAGLASSPREPAGNERPSPALVAATCGLLLVVAFSGLGLRRRRRSG